MRPPIDSRIAWIPPHILVEKEAHHVVEDYGSFWEDLLFESGALIVVKAFKIALHTCNIVSKSLDIPLPQFITSSVGYAECYGLSHLVAAYPTPFVNWGARVAQAGFLHDLRIYSSVVPITLFVLSRPP